MTGVFSRLGEGSPIQLSRSTRAPLPPIFVSWALISQHEPGLVASLHVVGAGPRVPCLPLVTGLRHSRDVPALRDAIGAAVADPAVSAERRALLIQAFVPLQLDDYISLPSLLG